MNITRLVNPLHPSTLVNLHPLTGRFLRPRHQFEERSLHVDVLLHGPHRHRRHHGLRVCGPSHRAQFIRLCRFLLLHHDADWQPHPQQPCGQRVGRALLEGVPRLGQEQAQAKDQQLRASRPPRAAQQAVRRTPRFRIAVDKIPAFTLFPAVFTLAAALFSLACQQVSSPAMFRFA